MQSTAEKIIDLIWKKPRTTIFDYYVNGIHARCDTLLLKTDAKVKSINSFINRSELVLEFDKVESDTVTKIYFKAKTSKIGEEIEQAQSFFEGVGFDRTVELNALLNSTCEVMEVEQPATHQRVEILKKFNKQMRKRE
ncbi:hypothetical protein [Holzapfeliella sp. JNUCC 80]